jgi:hypothetical protein
MTTAAQDELAAWGHAAARQPVFRLSKDDKI